MTQTTRAAARLLVLALAIVMAASSHAQTRGVPLDLSGYDPACGVTVEQSRELLTLRWPAGGGEIAQLVLDLRPGKPLCARMDVAAKAGETFRTVLQNVDPAAFVTVGDREAPTGRPPEMSVFNVFFDTPANRPHQTHRSSFELRNASVRSRGRRATVTLGELTAGPFAGHWEITVYAGARLIHLEAVVRTQRARTAFLYDMGLVSEALPASRLAWVDTQGVTHTTEPSAGDHHEAVRHRAIVAETDGGAVACFPPPHQYFFPRDLTENQQTVWYGSNHRGLDPRHGFGIRQTERGGGSYVPWFNAPPGSTQRLGVFLLLTRGKTEDALRETLRFTHGDRFVTLDGYRTFTSHFHMAIAMAALEEQARGTQRSTPDFVRMFKDLGVNIVHLAEFHGDGHPQDPGQVRLAELQAMFDECQRLSDEQLLFLPGEEANVYLGLPAPGGTPDTGFTSSPDPSTGP